MRNYFIAGNWKMHKTRQESAELATALVAQLKDGKHRYLVAPSFTALETVGKIVAGTNILLGAQNMAAEEQGAHTGEVSVLQLKDVGVQAVILGHSERRHLYKEDDALINKPLRAFSSAGFDSRSPTASHEGRRTRAPHRIVATPVAMLFAAPCNYIRSPPLQGEAPRPSELSWAFATPVSRSPVHPGA